jgi:hypothetical protein
MGRNKLSLPLHEKSSVNVGKNESKSHQPMCKSGKRIAMQISEVTKNAKAPWYDLDSDKKLYLGDPHFLPIHPALASLTANTQADVATHAEGTPSINNAPSEIGNKAIP